MNSQNHIHFEFDALDFNWDNVPARKFANYQKMKDLGASPDCFTVDGFPFMLQVEPTNLCNLKCPLCPAGTNRLERERRHLSLGEFQSLVDDLEDYLLFLVLWEWGEPFMHPDLPEMIRYAADRGIQTLTSTNAHFLHDEEYLKRILASGLTALIVAIDSLEQERYEVYRMNGQLEKATAGLRNLVRLKRELGSPTLINLRMVIMKQNEHELPRIRAFARAAGVDVFSVKTLNPSCGLDAEDGDLVPVNAKYRRYVYHPGTFERVRVDTHCRKMWFMCSVSANGEVIPCGYDYTSALQIGNINERPLSVLWNSAEAQALRRRLYYQRDDIPKCRECSVNYQVAPGGWFPEVIHFHESRYRRWLRQAHKRYARSPGLQQWVNALPGLKRVLKRACS